MKTFHLLLFVIFSASLLNAQVINVPDDHSSIQAAIEAAAEGDTILVEEGLYYENINFLGRAITLASHFILDGDTAHISKTIIDGSQATNPDSASVVLMISGEDTTSVLMGFTITGGKGSKLTMKWDGIGSTGLWGGGVAINNSGGKILHNTIENNILEPGSNLEEILGGGLTAIVNNNHSLIMRDNIIRNNSVTGPYANGGGAFLAGGRIIIEKNIIKGNEVFSKNIGGGAGIFWADYNNAGVINEVIIRENMISHNTGKSESDLFLGGGLALNFYIGEESVQVYNNIITDNYAEGSGGGIYLYITQATLFNNTIWNNEAKLGGNSLGLLGPSNIEMFNNIIRSDVENSLRDFAFTDYGNSFCYFWYNILKEEPTEDKVNTRGNSYQKPVFLPDSYELAEDSPGIGWGVDTVEIDGTKYFASPRDMKGNLRPHPIDDRIDMGAIESPYYRTPFAYDTEHVIMVPEEQATIQSAIDVAEEGDTVLVEEGVYFENINFLGKAITVASKYILEMDEGYIAGTVIDGSESNNPDTVSVVSLWSGEDTTSVLTGFTITGGRGSYVTGVHTAWDLDYYGGGGILIFNSGAKITNNIIEENHITDPRDKVRGALGCGILATVNDYHTAIIRNNTIRYNSGTDKGAWGGGLSLHGGAFLVENNTISYNTLHTTTIFGVGAGILWENESQAGTIEETVIRNNWISNNEALNTGNMAYGGAICLNLKYNSGEPHIYNNVVVENIVEGYGGALSGWTSTASIYNNTFIDNEATVSGKSLDLDGNVSFLLYNNIFWNYVDNDIPDYYFYEGGNSIRAYNNILNTPFSEGQPVVEENNTSMQPIFQPGTYLFAKNSPGIGWGVDSLLVGSTWVYSPDHDCDGNARPNTVDEFVDLGAFESRYVKSTHSTNIKNEFIKSGLSIYPNPVHDLLSIETLKADRYFIEITSLNGQQILSTEMQGNTGHVDLSEFAEGVYFLTIRSKAFVETRKIIKLMD